MYALSVLCFYCVTHNTDPWLRYSFIEKDVSLGNVNSNFVFSLLAVFVQLRQYINIHKSSLSSHYTRLHVSA
jgi:hypothetical protein